LRSSSFRFFALLLLAGSIAWSQPRRKVIIDEDCSGPGGTNLQTVLLLVLSPDVEVLGITIPSGDQWRDEEVAHTLRLLEIIGRTDIPVLRGAEFPLVNSRQEMLLAEGLDGKISYSGAWDARWWHEPSVVPALAEGVPTSKASAEDAAHFLIRMVHQYPNIVTIYEGAPMTDLALAQTIDPQFAGLAQELVFMGGSLNPQTADPEFANKPRHEFNFWFDPEAAEIVLRASWKKITCTTTDISLKTKLSPELARKIGASGTPAGRYIAKYFSAADGNDIMWDELAAAGWIDPSIITKHQTLYMAVNIQHGAGYGDTLTWSSRKDLQMTVQPVDVQMDLDTAKFYAMFVSRVTNGAK
jgi:purine nucleosidase